MTGNYRIHFLPKKVDLTPNCATFINMDSTKVHTKISKVSKSLNYISKSNFGHQIEEIMKKETAQKRRRLDRLSNKMIMRKKRGSQMYRFRIKKTRLGEISGELKLFNPCFMGHFLEKNSRNCIIHMLKYPKCFLMYPASAAGLTVQFNREATRIIY